MPIHSHSLCKNDFGEDQYLLWTDHVKFVTARAMALVRSKQFVFPSFTREDVEDAVQLCALLHDFGKGTQYFQIYLHLQLGQSLSQSFKSAGLIPNERLKDHSLHSAVCAFRVAQSVYADKSRDVREQLAVAVFLACASHHGSLKSQGWTSETLSEGLEGHTLNDLEVMFRALAPEMFEISQSAQSGSGRVLGTSVCRTLDIRHAAIQVRKTVTRVTRIGTTQTGTAELYILTMFLYSILLEADKFWLKTGEDGKELSAYDTAPNAVDEYQAIQYASAERTVMNTLRVEAYKEVDEALSQITCSEAAIGGFWTLTLPTGMGKTDVLANVGLKLAGKMMKAGLRPKVIVALPFLAVIEQSYEKYATIVGDERILKYHSLSDLGIGPMSDESDRDVLKFHADIWDRPFIVTTFDQLLYAFLSEKKGFASRFHQLFNAVVLLDEIQGVPHKAWKPFAEFVASLCKIGKSHFVISSATCPDFQIPGTRMLVEKPESYYNQLHRTRLCVDGLLKRLPEEELVQFLQNVLTTHQSQSCLIILNTVRCAQQVYKDLADRFPDRGVYSLTAALTPVHRACIIRAIKKGLALDHAPILVATQAVEAGVDLDFDVCVRDIAPLDSIIQAAGRTNRNWADEKIGTVYLIAVESSAGRLQAHMIYRSEAGGQSVEVEKALQILRDYTGKELHEEEFFGLVNHYFDWLKSRSVEDIDGIALRDALKSLSFDLQTKTIRQMLRGEDEKTTVYLLYDETTRKLLDVAKQSWESVQNKRFRFHKWEMALLGIRAGLAENSVGLYPFQVKKLSLDYIDASKRLFPYLDCAHYRTLYEFEVDTCKGVGLRYGQETATLAHTLMT